jgi:hypothetical protein
MAGASIATVVAHASNRLTYKYQLVVILHSMLLQRTVANAPRTEPHLALLTGT